VLAEGSLLRRSEEALASIGAEDAQPIPGQVTVEEALASIGAEDAQPIPGQVTVEEALAS